MIKNLKLKFGELVKNMQKYQTPGTPGAGVLRPVEESEKIEPEDQGVQIRSRDATLLSETLTARHSKCRSRIVKVDGWRYSLRNERVKESDKICVGYQSIWTEVKTNKCTGSIDNLSICISDMWWSCKT